jgi:hypothetical protein
VIQSRHEYDPDNLFRIDQNIKPSKQAGERGLA